MPSSDTQSRSYETRNDTELSSRVPTASSKNDLVQRLMREQEGKQHSDHATAVRQSLDPSEPSHSQEIQDDKHVTRKHDTNSPSNDTTNNQSSEVESTSDASIATPTEQMASKHTQGSKWKHWLKTAIIALLAATGSAQEVHNSMTSIRDNYGTVPILERSLEQRFMLRGSRDWPGLVQEQESKKHFSSLPQEKLAARSKQENCGGRKLLAWSEQSRRRNEWSKVSGRISKSVKKVRRLFPHFEL